MNDLAKAAGSGGLPEVEKILRGDRTSQPAMDLALARACCCGHLEIADVLLQHGADPNGQYETEPGKFEYGPIILASCEFLNAKGLQWLLEHGALPDGNPKDSQHFQCLTPLEMVRDTYVEDEAARMKCRELLLSAGAIPLESER